jgi:GntR family transcriptional regulator
MSETYYLSSSDPTPLYAQLTRAIQFAIATGKLNIGEQLPTVRQMAVDLRINANTVAKVYAELERKGIVETRRGVGTFISARRLDSGIGRNHEEHLRDFADRVIAEAGAMGFSLDDLVDHLGRRRKKENKHV